MIESIDLRALAEMNGNGRDFVSVYCENRAGFDGLKSRIEEIGDLLEDNADETEHFELTWNLIQEAVENHHANGQSFCVFGCGLLDFVQVHDLGVPVENELLIGPAPAIRQLAALRDEYQTFALVACSHESTSIHLVTEEHAELEERVRGHIKNRVKKGGWSQKRYARRRENQLSRYAGEISDALQDIVRRHEVERIVLIGSEQAMNEIEHELPEELAQHIIGKEAFDLHRQKDELVSAAYDIYFDYEREEERDLWNEIRNEVMRHGLGVTGPTKVLEALQQGRVETLLLTMDTSIPGTQCRECETVVHGTPETCQSCGSSSVFAVDLADVLTQLAETTSAWVEFSEEIPGLTRARHAAALLRY